MKRKPKKQALDIPFWVFVLWPLIVVAIVTLGFLAAEVIKTL